MATGQVHGSSRQNAETQVESIRVQRKQRDKRRREAAVIAHNSKLIQKWTRGYQGCKSLELRCSAVWFALLLWGEEQEVSLGHPRRSQTQDSLGLASGVMRLQNCSPCTAKTKGKRLTIALTSRLWLQLHTSLERPKLLSYRFFMFLSLSYLSRITKSKTLLFSLSFTSFLHDTDIYLPENTIANSHDSNLVHVIVLNKTTFLINDTNLSFPC